ncbi:MAG: porin, partial [Bacteroidota bacterium]|nr:porin [Bacteroidota bacterium]
MYIYKKISLLLLALVFVGANTFAQESVSSKTKDGKISWNSEDGQYQWSFGGRIYMDGVYYMDDATDLSSGTSIHDTRLYAKAKWGNWNTKINFDFSHNGVDAKDLYLDYNFDNSSYIRVGNFAEPFAIQGFISSKYNSFIGSSFTGSAFGIGRSVGISYTNYSDKYFLSGGIFGGKIGNNNSGDQGYSVSGKAVYTPIVKEGLTLHIGASASYRLPDANGFENNDDDFNRVVNYTAGPEHKFLNANIHGADAEIRVNAELIATYGAFMLQSEYFMTDVSRDKDYETALINDGGGDLWQWPSTEADYPAWDGEMDNRSFDGFYVQTGWLIKGADYSYNNSTAFINRPEAGSLELLLRFNNTNLNDIDGLFFDGKYRHIDPESAASGMGNFSIGGGESQDVSVAMNYYVSNNIMLRLNYTYMDI